MEGGGEVVSDAWEDLGVGIPGTDPATSRVFDVLAPVHGPERIPEYELGHEEAPTPLEVWGLAERVTRAALSFGRCRSRSWNLRCTKVADHILPHEQEPWPYDGHSAHGGLAGQPEEDP